MKKWKEITHINKRQLPNPYYQELANYSLQSEALHICEDNMEWVRSGRSMYPRDFK